MKRLSLLLPLVTVLFIACTPDRPVKIGLIVPLPGPSSPVGTGVRNDFRMVVVAVSSAFNHYVESSEGGSNRMRPLVAILNMAIWIVGILFLLDNLGFKISTVIAGIGIGGIAVALAAQAVLGDLFSYFVILLDRPFEVGDFFIFDDIL